MPDITIYTKFIYIALKSDAAANGMFDKAVKIREISAKYQNKCINWLLDVGSFVEACINVAPQVG